MFGKTILVKRWPKPWHHAPPMFMFEKETLNGPTVFDPAAQWTGRTVWHGWLRLLGISITVF